MKVAHFIGICGIGMSATAKLLKDIGWEISGSDACFYPPASDYLKENKISFKQGYRKENIPNDADLIVIGKNTRLTKKDNEEVAFALGGGYTIQSLPEVLSGLTKKSENIVIAGSYGKSICTSLMSWCLENAKKDPSYFIGAIPLNNMGSAKIGKSNIFILEGDEYPSSNWDNTSKFLHYNPHDVLLTSAEHDHVNVFPTHKKYLAPFKTLLSLIPSSGLLVASADDRSSLALSSTHTGNKILYGLNDMTASWSAKNIEFGEKTTFDLTNRKKTVVKLETSMLGEHSVQNIVGVSAMLLEKKLLSTEELASGIKTFKGLKRRLELKIKNPNVSVFEGFGSSYQKTRADIAALKLHFPQKKLIVVFEPHSFSLRNKEAIKWYDSMFNNADLVLIYNPAEQGSNTHEQLTQKEIVNRIQKSGIRAKAIHSEKDTLSIIDSELTDSSIILMSTSGALGGLMEKILNFVRQKTLNT